MSIGHRVVVAAVVIVLVIGAMSYSRYTRQRAREELLELRASLTLGLSQKEVEEIFSSAKYRDLTLLQPRQDAWIVNTPMEFGASNWCLHLSFTNNSLNGILVRLVDDPTRRPADAPPDLNRR